MIKDFEKLKRNYIKLVVGRGLNLPKGSLVRIFADFDQPDFVKLIVEECYAQGAKYVYVNWNYRPIEHIVKEKSSLPFLRIFSPLVKAEIDFDIANNVNYIYVSSDSSNHLNDIGAERASLEYLARRKYFIKKSGRFAKRPAFTFFSVPSEEWAKAVYPKLNQEQAMEKLWEAIFKMSHVNAKDPYKEWDEHSASMDRHKKWLDNLKIKSLHYTSKNGTDLVAYLPNQYCFHSIAHIEFKSKRIFYPNFPCEECYVSPHRLKVDGVLYATRPICVHGNIIDGIKFTFKHGEIIKVKAKQNERLLKQLINKPGMNRLGELALVPYSSPVCQTGIPIFYQTTIDENSGCHFALGSGFPYAYPSKKFLNDKKLLEKGINVADDHIDFAIGTSDLNIVATTKDNRQVQIFKDGEWAK